VVNPQEAHIVPVCPILIIRGDGASRHEPLSTADELSYLVERAGCWLLVTEDALREVARKTGVGTVRCVEDGWVDDADHADPVPVAPTDPLAVLYTSGTTSGAWPRPDEPCQPQGVPRTGI